MLPSSWPAKIDVRDEAAGDKHVHPGECLSRGSFPGAAQRPQLGVKPDRAERGVDAESPSGARHATGGFVARLPAGRLVPGVVGGGALSRSRSGRRRWKSAIQMRAQGLQPDVVTLQGR